MGLLTAPIRRLIAREVRNPLGDELPWSAGDATNGLGGGGGVAPGVKLRITRDFSGRITRTGDQRITR